MNKTASRKADMSFKRAIILSIVASVSVFLPWPAQCVEYTTGQVSSAILLQERINLTVPDKAVVNIGTRDGLIKGDLLFVTTSPDIETANQVAECAVLKFVDDKSSVCQIVKAKVEVERGNYASIKKLQRGDDRFFPAAFDTMSRTAEPYEPYRKINVYIHEIFDGNNNVTGLSKRIKKALEDMFSQKSKFRLKTGLDTKDFLFYPDKYREASMALSQTMSRSGVDVFITGSYAVNGGVANLNLIKFDKNYGDETAAFQIPLTTISEQEQALQIVLPYKPIQKKEYVAAKLMIKTGQYLPQKDELSDIVNYEGNGDVFTVGTLKRTGFNIISPVNVAVKIDGEIINLRGKDEIVIPALEKGVHRITASFRRGYFSNNRTNLLYSSARDIEKEVMLSIAKDGDVYMEFKMNAAFEKDPIDIKIYRQSERRHVLLKPVHRTESGKSVDFFKD